MLPAPAFRRTAFHQRSGGPSCAAALHKFDGFVKPRHERAPAPENQSWVDPQTQRDADLNVQGLRHVLSSSGPVRKSRSRCQRRTPIVQFRRQSRVLGTNGGTQARREALRPHTRSVFPRAAGHRMQSFRACEIPISGHGSTIWGEKGTRELSSSAMGAT